MRSPAPMVVPRPTLAAVSAAVAGLFLAAGGYFLYRAYDSGPAPAADTPAMTDPITGEPMAAFRPPVPYQTEFVVIGIAGVLCGVVAGSAAAWAYTRPADADPARGQAENRLALLAFGVAVGALLMLLGAGLFYLWFADLTSWLNKEEKPKVWKPLTALLVFLAGAAVAFLSAQPARGDERNSPGVRRTVYGVNLGLSAMLVFALLLVLNVAVGAKLPARLDTTESGLYTLGEPTRDYLRQLTTDLTFYSTVPEEGRMTDVARLLGSIREANPQRIKVKQLSQDLDKAEIAALKAKFKSTDLTDPADGSVRYGVLLAAGADEAKASFVSVEELFGRTAAQRGGPPPRQQFQGESRLAREILFLTENKGKSVVYFTQGAGEIAVQPAAPGAETGQVRTGEQLKAALTADGTEVKPLAFAVGATAKVPDDATAVVVADPRSPLADEMVAALRAYMTAKKPDGTLGKLVVLAGARPQPDGLGLLKTGLEGVLEAHGILLPPRALYASPTNQYPPETILGGVTEGAMRTGNTIALAYADVAIPFTNARRLEFKPRAEVPGRVDALFVTLPNRVTWSEDVVVVDSSAAFEALRAAVVRQDVGYLQPREPRGGTDPPRALALLASDPPDPAGKSANRVAVFAVGTLFADKPGGRPVQAELLAATVNWLRDRPALATETNKPYGVYEPNKAMKWTQAFVLPVSVTVIGLGTLGIGLWAWRRK